MLCRRLMSCASSSSLLGLDESTKYLPGCYNAKGQIKQTTDHDVYKMYGRYEAWQCGSLSPPCVRRYTDKGIMVSPLKYKYFVVVCQEIWKWYNAGRVTEDSSSRHSCN